MARLPQSLPQLLLWLPLGLAWGLLLLPYQALAELGFRLQVSLWLQPRAQTAVGALLVFAATAVLIVLAWGPLAAGRGGGLPPLVALDRAAQPPAAAEDRWLQQLNLASQLQRLPLMLLTHLGGLTVGIESPSVALGAGMLLAIRRRWPGLRLLADLSPRLVAVIGGAAGLGAAFRSPLLAVTYGLEELGQCCGLPLVLPTLLLACSGTLLASGMGQPARLPGLELGPLPAALWGWALAITLLAAAIGAVLVRLTITVAAWARMLLQHHRLKRRLPGALLLAGLLTLLALVSGGLSLNDGSLSLAPALAGEHPGPPLSLLWRLLSTVLSLATGAPGGLMHDSMSLGGLLIYALQGLAASNALGPNALAQLAAVGATALFASTNGTPLFCAAFVFTLQGDQDLLPLLLSVSAVAAALAQRWRGETWNEHQLRRLVQGSLPASTASSPLP